MREVARRHRNDVQQLGGKQRRRRNRKGELRSGPPNPRKRRHALMIMNRLSKTLKQTRGKCTRAVFKTNQRKHAEHVRKLSRDEQAVLGGAEQAGGPDNALAVADVAPAASSALEAWEPSRALGHFSHGDVNTPLKHELLEDFAARFAADRPDLKIPGSLTWEKFVSDLPEHVFPAEDLHVECAPCLPALPAELSGNLRWSCEQRHWGFCRTRDAAQGDRIRQVVRILLPQTVDRRSSVGCPLA